MPEEPDYTIYKDKEPTPLQERFVPWLTDKTGYDPTYAKTKADAFAAGVRLAVSLRIPFQASPENRAATEEMRAQREEEMAQARAAREEERATKAKEREEAAEARRLAAEEKTAAKAAKTAAKPAPEPEPEPQPAAKATPATRRGAKKTTAAAGRAAF